MAVSSGTVRKRCAIDGTTESRSTEAMSVFYDPLFASYYGSKHSTHEDRYLRIISARTVTLAERRSYEQAEEEF